MEQTVQLELSAPRATEVNLLFPSQMKGATAEMGGVEEMGGQMHLGDRQPQEQMGEEEVMEVTTINKVIVQMEITDKTD